MKAIILAAGRGSRMGHLTDDHPKCLTKVGCATLLERQIAALTTSSIKEIGIVCGYKAELLKAFGTRHFFNAEWSTSNMVHSLNAASVWLEQDTCVVSYSDIIYSCDAVERLLKCPGEISITYDPNWLSLWQQRFEDPLSDAETFQLDGEQCLTAIGQRAKCVEEIQGQYMGLLKITPKGWRNMVQYLEAIDPCIRRHLSLTELLHQLIPYKIYATPIVDAWYEVDSEKDLAMFQQN